MARFAILFALLTAAFGQSPDTALTQTLITEIRTLRQEIQATTVTAQRVQIVLYRLQSQTTLLAGAQQRLDAARTRVIEVGTAKKHVADEIRSTEEFINTQTDATLKKQLEGQLREEKMHLEGIVAEEGLRRGFEADAESQVRAEQAKVADLQALLERLDKALDELAKAKR
jgi:thymidylate synthase